MKKLKSKVKSFFTKLALTSALAMSSMATVAVHADPIDPDGGGSDGFNIGDFEGVDGKEAVNGTFDILFDVMLYAGIGAAVFGLYELFMGLTKDGQSDKKVQGILFIAGGSLLAGARGIIYAIFGM